MRYSSLHKNRVKTMKSNQYSNYGHAARAYDDWVSTDPAMEAQAEEDAFIENIEEGVYKAVTQDTEELLEMLWSGTREKEMKEFCRCLLNFFDDSSKTDALAEAFDLLAAEFAHDMAVEASEDPDGSRWV